MTEVPRIVVDRLRAPWSSQPGTGPVHPDADLLTALAEQKLPPPERDGVLEHLALCEDCRDVVILALPPVESVASKGAEVEAFSALPGATKTEQNWLAAFGWPGLRWAALAAAVIVAGSLLLTRHGNAPVPAPANPQVAVTEPVAPAPQAAGPPMNQIVAQTNAQKSTPELPVSKKLKAGQVASQPTSAESGMLMADAKIGNNKEASPRPDTLGPPAGTGALAYDAPARPATTSETVEVSGQAAAVDTRDSLAGNLMARDEAPAIEKAKPPLPEAAIEGQQKDQAVAVSKMARSKAVGAAETLKTEASARQALAPILSWRIAAGFLQRSMDGGWTWQIGLRSDHPLLCYATLGSEVWAGGGAGALFHSTDGGASWVRVQPVFQSQSLSADIVSIQVQGSQVALSSNNNETWSTADGGKTWEKK